VDKNKVTSPKPGFAPVTLDLLLDKRIGDPTTVAVYAALSSFANYESADCFPSHRKIGERARCDERTVRRHIDLLCQFGYLEKRAQPGYANIYHLADPWGRKAPESTDMSVQGVEEGRTPVTRGVDMGDQGGRTPVTTKREGENEKKKREGETVADAPAAPPSLLASLEEEGKKRGVVYNWADPKFIAKITNLEKTVPREYDILLAFRAFLDDSARGGVTPFWFPERFEKYKKKRLVRQTEAVVSQPSEPRGYADDDSIAKMLAKVHAELPWSKGDPAMSKTA